MEIIRFIENGRSRKGVVKICPVCLTEFPSRIKNGKLFCCNKCSAESRKSRIEIDCAWCGKKFERLLSRSSGVVFCTRKCKDAAQKLDGIKDIHPQHYGSAFSRYSNLIRRTENPSCCGCGELKRYLLTVHHINGKRRDNSESNLEIVCGNCHMKRHLKFVNGLWVYSPAYLTPRELLKEM